ncbi:pectate lyase superfamily protein-domain-containing protein [Fusarium sp. MPI-SDFR-AT-0072]|nr:pectate lyase superfamily protein-domain-containing protein [Fusarium sp. MPI-SDFR-AT-0072]
MLFRRRPKQDVKDFSAKGDRVADDMDAINKAISSGGRYGRGKYIRSIIYLYYNTEMIGNPLDLPTIIAAPSFIGLGVITSNISAREDFSNFFSLTRYLVYGIHWQVIQGTSLENFHFYIIKFKDNPKITQQGIYMENGSGSFLSDLYFVRGKFSQGIGSLHLTDLRFHYVNVAVSTSVMSDNSTALLLSNSGFYNVDIIGFRRVTSANGTTAFHNSANLDSLVRNLSLITGAYSQFFTRRRPKAYGAKGDGQTDNTAVLNHLFYAAANISAVVYIPFGVYIIKDTLDIPVGVVEIQNIIDTIKGVTAGAVIMEWNVHESGQGSAGLWDTHFRVGGAAGTDLTVKDYPKVSGKVNKNWITVSLILYLTSDSSGYFKKV